MNRASAAAVWLCVSALGCSPSSPGAGAEVAPRAPASAKSAAPLGTPGRPLTLSIVGTNDLHGRIDALPVLGGYLNNLRRARARDGGAVLLVDAGDMFQGTLESNLGEGAAVVSGYTALGYQAVAIGNHEFDFGPAGAAATARNPGDDPRGALKARAASAPFPFLLANVRDASTGRRIDWPNVPASVMIEVGGVKVGIVGAATEETPRTTIRANFAGLAMAPVAETVGAEAAALRARGAEVVIAVAHAGGRCDRFGGDPAADGCDADSEMFQAARALPAGAVDVFVGGHTHAGVAHRLHGIALIESLSYGKAFGRVDLTLDAKTHKPTEARIWKPQMLCARGEGRTCEPEPYEGAPVVPDEAVARAIAPHIEQAKQKRNERIGVRLGSPISRAYGEESALGNLFADLIRSAVPAPTTIGLMNGGGLRADLPEGDLTYGSLYEAFPFDNKVAVARVKVAEVRALLLHHFRGRGGILSISGATVLARCEGGELVVELRKPDGKPLKNDEAVQLVASDFMLTGGDDFWGPVSPPAIDVKDALVRDAMASQLAARRTIRDADVLDPKRPRLAYPGKRPVSCQPGPR